eukprot:scaffold334199_cov33-Prasinocladus_malaysianus.AAC.1
MHAGRGVSAMFSVRPWAVPQQLRPVDLPGGPVHGGLLVLRILRGKERSRRRPQGGGPGHQIRTWLLLRPSA